MITEAGIRQAAQRQPTRYVLHKDSQGKLVAFEDCDTGYSWFLLPDDTWAWVA